MLRFFIKKHLFIEDIYTRFMDVTELFWYTEDGFFRFSYNIPDEEIFKIIDSLAPVEQE